MSKNSSAKHYQEKKERVQKKAGGRYQNLSREEKEKQQQYGCKRQKNFSDNEKRKLVEYRKNVIEREKIPYYNDKKLLF